MMDEHTSELRNPERMPDSENGAADESPLGQKPPVLS
jgi:hypothetical protein